MIDLQTNLLKIRETEYEIDHSRSRKQKGQLTRYLHRLHKERSECMKYLRGELKYEKKKGAK